MCNQLLHILWLKTTLTYYLTVLEVQCYKMGLSGLKPRYRPGSNPPGSSIGECFFDFSSFWRPPSFIVSFLFPQRLQCSIFKFLWIFPLLLPSSFTLEDFVFMLILAWPTQIIHDNLFKIFLIYFYWSIVDLQCCVSLWCTAKGFM